MLAGWGKGGRETLKESFDDVFETRSIRAGAASTTSRGGGWGEGDEVREVL